MIAREKLSQVSRGIDPRDTDDQNKKKSITFRKFASEYMEKYCIPNNKPRTVKDRQYYLDKYLLPRIGSLKLERISRKMVVDLHTEIEEKHGLVQGNRAISALRAMFNIARDWELCENNPAQAFKKRREKTRKRYASDEELSIIFSSIKQEKDPFTRSYFLMLLFTAARSSEVRFMQWDDLSKDLSIWSISDTKNHEEHTIYLGPLSKKVLSSLPHYFNNPYVFAGRKDGQNFNGATKAWSRILSRTLIKDMTIHDMRRSSASLLKRNGMSDESIASLLNHKDLNITRKICALQDKSVGRKTSEELDRLLQPLVGPLEPMTELRMIK